MSSSASASTKKKKRKKKQPSCAVQERRARKIRNKRKRRAALKKVRAHCGPAKKPKPTRLLPQGTQPAATMVAPVISGPVPDVPAAPDPSGLAVIKSPIPVYSGTFGVREAARLLWRAGFGPRPGQAAEVAAMGLENAVLMLTRPSGDAPMDGPEPTAGGAALDPLGTWGHDHLWWMDRMVRSRHQLVERLALVFHDWFATSNDGVGSVPFMLAQTNLFRVHGLGNFGALVRAITPDPAMLIWLSGLDNRRNAINENYARELMELFCLGADRGAYTETDVRELARSLSGFTADWDSSLGYVNFRWSSSRWDSGTKTVFGKAGKWGWQDAVNLVLDHPMHASFFVRKLWSYFVPVPPADGVAAALERLYVDCGHEIRPVLEAILCSPELIAGPAMVKPPVVFAAGMMRSSGDTITSAAWEWASSEAGQRLFYPPDVSGWDDERWLDTNTVSGRWQLVNQALEGHTVNWPASASYPAETPAQALANARAFWNDPLLSPETVTSLATWTAGALTGINTNAPYRAQRQAALRTLIAMSPDCQVC